MQVKTINKIIETHFDKWIQSIPEPLQKRAEQHCYVAGGAIASLCLGEVPNDFDVYCEDLETLTLLAQHYVNEHVEVLKALGKDIPGIQVISDQAERRVRIKIQSSGVSGQNTGLDGYEYFEITDATGRLAGSFLENTFSSSLTQSKAKKKKGTKDAPKTFSPIFLTENAITLSDGIQLITRFSGYWWDVVESFDFDHTRGTWVKGGDHPSSLGLGDDTKTALLFRCLTYRGSKYPICALLRARKFIKRGWHFHAGDLLKIAFDINGLDLSNPRVLADQLIGVDFAYFAELLRMLAADLQKNPDMKIDKCYIVQLLDRLDIDGVGEMV